MKKYAVKHDWWKKSFGNLYYDIYSKVIPRGTAMRDVDFIIRSLDLHPPMTILDVACGYGRHSLEFARRGFSVTGVDYSKTLLARAQKTAKRERLKINFIRQDMRELRIVPSFDVAVNLFTSFGYFKGEQDHVRVLKNVYAALKPGGRFILDVINPTGLRSLKQQTNRFPTHSFFNSKTMRWTMFRTSRDRTLSSSVRVFSRLELSKLLAKTDFAVKKVWGSFFGEAWVHSSPRIIILAQKKAPRRGKPEHVDSSRRR